MSLLIKSTTDLTPLGASRIYLPNSLCWDNTDLYIGSYVYVGPVTYYPVIRKVDRFGRVTTLCGGAGAGHVNGQGATAQFAYTGGMAVDNAGNVYFTDGSGIRKMTPDGTVSDFVGPAAPAVTTGHTNGTGTAARFNGTSGLVFDATCANLYVCDYNNHCIRKVTVPGGVVSDFAGVAAPGNASGYTDGTGTGASFNAPSDLVFDAAFATLYVAEFMGECVRKVTVPGAVVTHHAGGLAGEQDYVNATGSAARFNDLTSICFDANGYLYTTEIMNQAVRRVNTAGKVSTVVGCWTSNMAGFVDGYGTKARLHGPSDIALGPDGVLYVADRDNHAVRKVYIAGGNRALVTWFGTPYADPAYMDVPDTAPTSIVLDVQ